jgi:hypothetical protein
MVTTRLPRAAHSIHLRHGRALAAGLLALLVLAAPAAAQPLRTGITDPLEPAFGEHDPDAAYGAVRDAGGTIILVPVFWVSTTNGPPREPTNPGDRAYLWRSLDDRIARMTAAGLEPLLAVSAAPLWARTHAPDGRSRVTPNPSDLAAFVTALARRYDGGAHPRVRLFQVWNEPNLKTYMDQDGAPADYRAMLAAAYPAIHAVHDDNVVVAAGTAPFAGPDGRYGVGPLKFMRELLSERTEFDVWAHHPYTSGPPARRATVKDDASIGDLPALRRILRRAQRADRARSARIWATEFSWDSTPPDPFAVPLREHARWVAESFFRMWANGVELVVWFQLRDNPKGTFTWAQTFQSGLYMRTTDRYADEKAKPALRAFRFPFVALPAGRGVRVWGRTPGSGRAKVVVERRVRGRWRRVATLRADGDGIFTRRLRGLHGARLRARIGGDASLPFAARKTRNRFVNPFGGSELPPNG